MSDLVGRARKEIPHQSGYIKGLLRLMADEIERLQAEVLHCRGMTKGRESEIEKHLAEIERLREIINTRLPDQGRQIKSLKAENAKLQAVVDAGMKIMPSGHSGECVNDNLYYEPEQITFSKCDRCLYRDALAALDTVDEGESK